MIIRLKALAILVTTSAIAACASVPNWNGAVAGSTRFHMTDQPCATRCSDRINSEHFPINQVRHGIDITDGGLFGPGKLEIVDLDAGTLSFIEFDADFVGGKRRTIVLDRGDIVLDDDSLAQLGAIANSIWTSPAPVPTAQVAIDGFWSIGVFNGPTHRGENGMGNIGGDGLLLRKTLNRIRQSQMPYFFMQSRRRFVMWSCYASASSGNASVPKLYLRTPGYSSDDSQGPPQSFPIPPTNPLAFRFYSSNENSTCADTTRVLSVSGG